MSAPGRKPGEPASLDIGLRAIAGFAQVNLLEVIPITRQRSLPWWAPLASAGVVAAAALGSSLYLNPEVTAQKARIAAVESRVLEHTQRLEAAARASKPGNPAEQAQALQAALAQQERLLALLGGAVSDAADSSAAAGRADTAAPTVAPTAAPTTQAFSALLEGLSRTRVDGLWLTQVRLDRRTQVVQLEGQTRHPQLVSTYIDDLSRNPRFQGLVLATLDVSRPAGRPAAGPTTAGGGEAAAPAPELASFRLASAPQASAGPAGAAVAVPPNPRSGSRP